MRSRFRTTTAFYGLEPSVCVHRSRRALGPRDLGTWVSALCGYSIKVARLAADAEFVQSRLQCDACACAERKSIMN